MLVISKEYKHPGLPISGLHKIGDLINLQGPVLSLFQDSSFHHYLYYWLDSNDEYERWLVWKVSSENLYYYLEGDVSLLDLIQADDKEYMFVVDIDPELNYVNAFPLERKLIPVEYQPEVKSFFRLALPEFAKNFIDTYERSANYYKVLMKRNSIIFNISPSDINFPRAVSTQDAGAFLYKLTRSLTGFIEERFWTKYRDLIPSSTEFNKLLHQVRQILTPRMFGLKFGSFEVSVGVDIIKKVDVEGFGDWQKEILPEFKKDVVDIDYSNTEQLQTLSDKYSEAAREKIYNPYIQIINSNHYQFVIKDKADKIVKTYKKVEKEKEDLIVPIKKRFDDPSFKEKKLISLVVEMMEGQTVEELTKKALHSGLLFSEQLSELSLHLKSASSFSRKLYFKMPLPYMFSVQGNTYSAYVPDLGLYLENENKDALIQNLEIELVSLQVRSEALPDSDPIKMYFKSIIDRIEENDQEDPF